MYPSYLSNTLLRLPLLPITRDSAVSILSWSTSCLDRYLQEATLSQTVKTTQSFSKAFIRSSEPMSASLPPDLRVLSRKLVSIPPTQLPHALPSLINHVLHCKEALSEPSGKVNSSSSEAAQLVHKIKTSITTHLNGRSREARFAAVALIKTVVDVGGWEALRGCQPWVTGLMSVVDVRYFFLPSGMSQILKINRKATPLLQKSWLL